MKAAEFRLGNLLQATARGGRKVFKPIDSGLMQIIISMVGAEAIHGENVFLNFTWQPVPLDAEWLERLGFEQNGMYWFVGKFRVWEWGLVNIHYHTHPLEDRQFQEGVELKYVHQVQNIYFALTGEELKIDNTTV